LLYGGAGKKKAADLQIENEAKLLKDLIRGLCANKTENSIISKVVGGLTCMILVMPGASIPIPSATVAKVNRTFGTSLINSEMMCCFIA
jgi:hypothetical protein